MKTYYIYILLCSNNSYYTGYTLDIKRRFDEHCDGTSKSKYTRAFKPIEIAACWQIQSDSSSKAMKLESLIKRQSRSVKIKLINDDTLLARLLDQYDLLSFEVERICC